MTAVLRWYSLYPNTYMSNYSIRVYCSPSKHIYKNNMEQQFLVIVFTKNHSVYVALLQEALYLIIRSCTEKMTNRLIASYIRVMRP